MAIQSILTYATHHIKHNRDTKSTGGYVDYHANLCNVSITAT